MTTRLSNVLRSSRLSNLTVALALLAGGLAGCATPTSQPAIVDITAPVSVRVHWVSSSEASQQCGANKAGCMRVADTYTEIWAERPTHFDDFENVCALGDVLMGVLERAAMRTDLAAAETNLLRASPTSLLR